MGQLDRDCGRRRGRGGTRAGRRRGGSRRPALNRVGRRRISLPKSGRAGDRPTEETLQTDFPDARGLVDLWPLVEVIDPPGSMRFCRNTLGFDVVDTAEADGRVYWCRVRRGACSVMLQGSTGERRSGAVRVGVTLYFVCDDADAVHAELSARGLRLPPPVTAPYGMRQVEFEDPDGYRLCFESRVGGPPDGR